MAIFSTKRSIIKTFHGLLGRCFLGRGTSASILVDAHVCTLDNLLKADCQGPAMPSRNTPISYLVDHKPHSLATTCRSCMFGAPVWKFGQSCERPHSVFNHDVTGLLDNFHLFANTKGNRGILVSPISTSGTLPRFPDRSRVAVACIPCQARE